MINSVVEVSGMGVCFNSWGTDVEIGLESWWAIVDGGRNRWRTSVSKVSTSKLIELSRSAKSTLLILSKERDCVINFLIPFDCASFSRAMEFPNCVIFVIMSDDKFIFENFNFSDCGKRNDSFW